MNSSFEHITALQYRLKAVQTELQSFLTGDKYVRMENEQKKMIRSYERYIKKLKQELVQARQEIIRIRNQWFEVFGDLEKELQTIKEKSAKELHAMEERALRAERRGDEAQAKITEQRHKIYELETSLEEEKGKNLKLTAQLNHDYENSSMPSSMTIKKKKIANSREKTGRKPGGQPGHAAHPRKKQEPTEAPILLEPPQEVLDDPDYRKTPKTIVKQAVGIQVSLVVKEYHADVYYNSKTGERVHAAFPEGIVDDVNYDGSIKAFLFLLNNDCCTSIDKSRKFLSDLTYGKLNISKGMINKLSKEFAKKTEAEQKELFQRLLMAPVMHTDCTTARENGENVCVFVCATPNGEAMYFARLKKGHEGIKGTPVEDYAGILVHDHDITFYSYGSNHQECLSHILRYLLDSIENEPDREWNKEMHSLIREMIHYRNGLPDGEKCDDLKVTDFEKRYQEILQKAKEEYEYEPPSKYYKDGYNLFARMDKYKENHLLFLHDPRVPSTNNESERRLRSYKRKQKQAISFRSFESIDYLCQCMSMLVEMREKGENVYDRVSQIFGIR